MGHNSLDSTDDFVRRPIFGMSLELGRRSLWSPAALGLFSSALVVPQSLTHVGHKAPSPLDSEVLVSPVGTELDYSPSPVSVSPACP